MAKRRQEEAIKNKEENQEAEAKYEDSVRSERADYIKYTQMEKDAMYDADTYIPEYDVAPQSKQVWEHYFAEQLAKNEPDADTSIRMIQLVKHAQAQNLVSDAPTLAPTADFSSLAVNASEDIVVTHEAG
jgi:hypothetical protein